MESNSGKDSEWGQNENHRANIEARGGAMRISFSLPPFFVPWKPCPPSKRPWSPEQQRSRSPRRRIRELRTQLEHVSFECNTRRSLYWYHKPEGTIIATPFDSDRRRVCPMTSHSGTLECPPGSYVSFSPLVYFTVTSKGKISMPFLIFSCQWSPGTDQILACAILSVFQTALLHNCGKLTYEPVGSGVLYSPSWSVVRLLNLQGKSLNL